MTGPVPNSQDEPLDLDAYAHQLRLLKSAHCCRPVLYQGKHQFINSLTVHHGGSGIGMIVWLKGITDAIDSADIQIKPTAPSEENSNA
ncbi:hypothetical protein [Massilia aerilata]|uniref:Uncharacterized protein n=1 Tax=Massilia aerilata TaxID=453817 RepID=A0ABW0RX47_9BURK